MNSFELSRNFFNWTFENPERVSPGHIAVYFYAIELCNSLGSKEKFGLPTTMAMEAVGIKKPHTFIKYLNDLVEWGFITMVQKSKNQFTANIISINNAMPKNSEASGEALGKATGQQVAKQRTGTGSITKLINKEINKERESNKPSNVDDVIVFFKAIGLNGKSEAEAHKFFNHFESNGWLVGNKAKMKNWEAAARNWASRIPSYNPAGKPAKKEIIYPSSK